MCTLSHIRKKYQSKMTKEKKKCQECVSGSTRWASLSEKKKHQIQFFSTHIFCFVRMLIYIYILYYIQGCIHIHDFYCICAECLQVYSQLSRTASHTYRSASRGTVYEWFFILKLKKHGHPPRAQQYPYIARHIIELFPPSKWSFFV